MEFRVLGPLEVVDGGRTVELGAAKLRALLAVLLLNANRVVSTEALIDALWEEHPPETAGKAIQVYVSNLRKVVGPDALRRSGPGYVLVSADAGLDLARLEALREEARQAAPRDAARKLREALSLWRGPSLADFANDRFAQPEITRLDELRLVTLEERIDADLAAGRHGELVGELEALVAEHPFRERLRSQLVLALYRCGRQAEALDSYRNARRALVGELGIEPGRELRRLEAAILRQDPALDLVRAEEGEEARAGPFVGRERELAELVAGLDDAIAGRGRLFLLVGEPGIGKSRLADELLRVGRGRGARVLVGRCWEAGGAPVYWPWVQSLRAYVRSTPPGLLTAQLGASAAELAQILPELRELLPGLPEPGQLEPEAARFRLFDATAEFLRNAAAARPIVLFLDDLHAADTPSLLLLQYLAREVGSARLLIVGALRDVDPLPVQSLSAMLAEVAREPGTRRLSLGGLSERDIAEYVRLTIFELEAAELASGLYEQTEGNALFLTETVRLLAEERGPARLAIPHSVREVISRRLSHLSSRCNQTLVLASVLGREFELPALAALAGASEDELLETLDEAMIARVVSDVPGGAGRLRFSHVLIRDAIYDELTTARRVRLHRLGVDALEALHGDDPGAGLAELAHHAIAGSDFERGLSYAEQAGDRALAMLAYEEAARQFQIALDALALARPQDDDARCQVLLSLADAQARAGNTSTAKEAALEAIGIARRLGLANAFARGVLTYSGRFAWGRAAGDRRLVPLLEEALAALAQEDAGLRVRLLACLAGALRDEHSRSRREQLGREAVDLARRLGEPGPLMYALDGLGVSIVGPDTIAECMALGDELHALASSSGDVERVVAGLDLRIISRTVAGDVDAAVADIAEQARIAEALRQPGVLWLAHGNRAMLDLARGRFAEAEELADQTFQLGRRVRPELAGPIYWLQRQTLCDFRGTLDEIGEAIAPLVDEHPTRPVLRCALAHLHARLGRLTESRRIVDELAADGFAALPFDQEWLYAMSLLAETCVLLGDAAPAGRLYELLLPWASRAAADFSEGFRGSVSHYLALLAGLLDRRDTAARHFEDALAANGRMGVRPWLARTQRDYARLLLERRDPGDAERAELLLAEARATFRELGMADA